MPDSEELASIGRRGTVIEFLQLPCPYQEQCAYNGNFAEIPSHLMISHSIAPAEMQNISLSEIGGKSSLSGMMMCLGTFDLS